MKYILLIIVLGLSKVYASNRDDWQKPEKVFKAFSLPDDKRRVFCEIGAGEGYFSLKASKRYHSVYAAEISDDSISKLKGKIDLGNISNIHVVKSKEDDPLFPEGKCDIIFMGMVYHHINDRVEYLKNLRRYLAPKGRFVNLDNVIDVKKYEGTGKRIPAKECRFPKEKFVKEVKAAQFVSIKELNVLPMQYLFEVR